MLRRTGGTRAGLRGVERREAEMEGEVDIGHGQTDSEAETQSEMGSLTHKDGHPRSQPHPLSAYSGSLPRLPSSPASLVCPPHACSLLLPPAARPCTNASLPVPATAKRAVLASRDHCSLSGVERASIGACDLHLISSARSLVPVALVARLPRVRLVRYFLVSAATVARCSECCCYGID
ncbi:hypothetical protein FKP32DRAFT_1172325 [Trametes sanguinea]|nr:hypothetical protein FKP32DRAFT_1172325 [Trametes sanguinea]